MTNTLNALERENAVANYGDDTFPSCDAYESGCSCDLCRDDDSRVLEWDRLDKLAQSNSHFRMPRGATRHD